MELSERILEIRKNRRLTQEEVASELNVSRQTISNWETGSAQPTIDKAAELARLYNISLDEMVGLRIEEHLNQMLMELEGKSCTLYLKIPESELDVDIGIYRSEYKNCILKEIANQYIKIEFKEKKQSREKIVYLSDVAAIIEEGI